MATAEPTAESTDPATTPKLTAVEVTKSASNYLAGDIAKELTDGAPGFGKGSIQLLKNHGTYQQDDRETRKKSADGKKSERQVSFMIRTCVPGGKLTASQLLSAIDLGDEVGNGTIRLTTRQAIQHHGVVKGDLKPFMRRIHDVQMSSLAGCGDVERNIMCCPAPIHGNPVRDEMQAKVDELAKHLAPRTRAYYEIWLTDPDTGEKTLAGGTSGEKDVEPIYGPTYLPRKFKTAFALPEDNCTDIYANDLGFLVVHEGGKILGYNVLAVAESERVLPGLIDSLEPEVARLGLSHDAFTLRMTGCPNACARPYNSDIGIVGRTLGKYTIFLGGRLLGDRLNEQYKDVVPFDDLSKEITAVLACYKAERKAGETLGDFCHRKGMDGVRTWANQWLAGSRGHG